MDTVRCIIIAVPVSALSALSVDAALVKAASNYSLEALAKIPSRLVVKIPSEKELCGRGGR